MDAATASQYNSTDIGASAGTAIIGAAVASSITATAQADQSEAAERTDNMDVAAVSVSDSIAAALAAWNYINLAKLQKTLDAQGLEIVENQKESNKNKKKLSELTKDFKKIPDEEKLNQFKSLLKAYQQEIDSITKRSKTAESAFLSLYKLLAEAPDPSPLLHSLSTLIDVQVRLAEREDALERMTAELKEERENVRMGKDAERDLLALKSRLATYEQKLDEMVSEKVLEKEIEIKQATDEKIRIYKETEYSLQRQLNLMKDQLSQLQSSHDSTQARLVDYSSQYDQEVATKLGELEIVVADLERANTRAAAATRENEQIKSEIAALRGDAKGAAVSTAIAGARHEWQDPVTLQRKIKAQDAEISNMLDDLDKLKTRLSEKEASSGRRINELEREVAVKKLDLEQLREKLLQFDDYERIKRELDVLKCVEFTVDGASGGGEDGLWDEAPLSGEGADKSLERLLMDKNKRLQGEATGLKDALEAAQADLRFSQEELESVKLQSDTQRQLIGKLEEDMYNLNSIVALHSGASPKVVTPGKAAANAAAAGDMDPLMAINVRSKIEGQPDLVSVLGSSVIPIAVGTKAGGVGGGAGPGQGGAANSSIVPILASQRDRYRQRNAELEEQAKQYSSAIADLKFNVESLKNDNVKLYEKLRYAESFSKSGGGSHTVTITPTTPTTATATTRRQNAAGTDDVQSRYNSLYETTLDPFQRFARVEQANRVQKLNPAEKAALVFTRILVGNKYTRVGFVVYSVVLHLLVFATLYLLSQWEECRHDHIVPKPPSNIH